MGLVMVVVVVGGHDVWSDRHGAVGCDAVRCGAGDPFQLSAQVLPLWSSPRLMSRRRLMAATRMVS